MWLFIDCFVCFPPRNPRSRELPGAARRRLRHQRALEGPGAPAGLRPAEAAVEPKLLPRWPQNPRVRPAPSPPCFTPRAPGSEFRGGNQSRGSRSIGAEVPFGVYKPLFGKGAASKARAMVRGGRGGVRDHTGRKVEARYAAGKLVRNQTSSFCSRNMREEFGSRRDLRLLQTFPDPLESLFLPKTLV